MRRPGSVARELFGSSLAALLILILAAGLVAFSDGRHDAARQKVIATIEPPSPGMLIRDAMCGAGYGERTESGQPPQRLPAPGFDTRAGGMDVAIPKLRSGSYFADWLLQRRKRAEPALTSVVATCYLLGVSTRRMERLVESLGVTSLSKSQVSIMAKELDEAVGRFAPPATPDRTHSSPPTRWCSRSVKSAESSGCIP